MTRSLILSWVFLALAEMWAGRAPSLNPQPVRATLRQILETLDQYPSSPETGESIAGIRQSVSWLVGRLKDEVTPALYARSLERNLALLRSAARLGKAQRTEVLRAVLDDLRLKHADCRQSGMGRLVRLEVRTIRGSTEVRGWQVFYRWLPGRTVGEVRPQPFLSLSSPTSVEIPPGAYSVYALKAVDGKEVLSKELPVPVGGNQKVTIEVVVP
ncbi:MAG: hypothetical protein A2107_14700 [Verrucomicrobia bacterium GWF2_62_7]|nr:MAG: hypothetical protein A2107_14700 [Verrucomicrobia bacterium GWF2_62_7]